jgi:hypothetical protein
MRLLPGRLVLLLLSAAIGVSAAPASVSAEPIVSPRAADRCVAAGDDQLSQAMSGRVSGCVRVGPLPAGPHTIALKQFVSFSPTASGEPRRALPKPRRPSEPVVTLSLSPASGRPGTVVTLIGHLRKPFHPRYSYPTVCWDGCQGGLKYATPTFDWTSPRTFRTHVVVPDAPWIEQRPLHVAPLADGSYRIGVKCIRSATDCAAVTDGSATFHLRDAREPSWCRTQSSCARLVVTPGAARPADTVRITGYAPLQSVSGSDEPDLFGTETLRGRPHGPEVDFGTRNGATQVTLGRGALHVTAPQSYTSLGPSAPIAETTDGLPQIATDPADPATVAWCSGTTIAVAGPGGTSQISTATVNEVLTRMGFGVTGSQPAQCTGVAPVETTTGAPVGLAVAFSVALAAGAPPFYSAALVTDDGGQTWSPVPVPGGSSPAGFAGFRYIGAALEAVFAANLPGGPKDYPDFRATAPLAEVSGADGLRWTATPLSCPQAGPCDTLAPYFAGNCAMNGSTQSVLTSTDGGRRWSAPPFPYPVQSCGEAELVATSSTSELLIDSTSEFPVVRSTDAGATWHDVGLPLPAGARRLPLRTGPGGLTVLPDGSLLLAAATGHSGGWQLLRHGARSWCPVRTPNPAQQRRTQLTPVTVIAGRLWWLTGTPDSSGAPAVDQVNLSALAC